MTAERIAATLACTLVAGGIIAGFWLIGSPQTMRAQALDRRRAEDLRAVAAALKARYSGAGQATYGRLPPQLPNDLRALRQDRSDVTRDPVTGERYGYARETAGTYRLCATFARADDAPDNVYLSLQHPAGRACFRFNLSDSEWAKPVAVPVPVPER
jgi:type II secretory pathway pseudopilin PulG